MAKKKMTKEETRKLAKQFADMELETQVEPLIQDNKIEFTFENQKYRVRLPTLQERMELGQFIHEKKVANLLEGKLKTEQELHEIFAKRGININEIEKKMITLKQEHDIVLERLAKIDDLKVKEELKRKVIELREERYVLSIEKRDLLAGSLEQYIIELSNTYLLYLVFEQAEKKAWSRVFKSYEDLANCQNLKLIYNANNYLTALMTFDYV